MARRMWVKRWLPWSGAGNFALGVVAGLKRRSAVVGRGEVGWRGQRASSDETRVGEQGTVRKDVRGESFA